MISKIYLKSPLVILAMTMFMIQSPVLLAQEINLEKELILYLPMNGNALDESGNNVSTKLEGPVLTSDRYGNPDQAYLFDGINDNIILNDNHALITSNQFTICMWAKINDRSQAEPTTNNPLFEQRNDNPGASSEIIFLAERFGDTFLGFRSNGASAGEYFQADYPGDRVWYHFTAMLDENRNVYLFINGSLKTTGKLVGNGDFSSEINRVGIGTNHSESLLNGAFNGAIDEVFVYSRALKLCEIEALYSGQLQEER